MNNERDRNPLPFATSCSDVYVGDADLRPLRSDRKGAQCDQTNDLLNG